jgi:hypothetical protein
MNQSWVMTVRRARHYVLIKVTRGRRSRHYILMKVVRVQRGCHHAWVKVMRSMESLCTGDGEDCAESSSCIKMKMMRVRSRHHALIKVLTVCRGCHHAPVKDTRVGRCRHQTQVKVVRLGGKKAVIMHK